MNKYFLVIVLYKTMQYLQGKIFKKRWELTLIEKVTNGHITNGNNIRVCLTFFAQYAISQLTYKRWDYVIN